MPLRSFPRGLIALLLISVVILASSGDACAFHDGGVGNCEGCHTMHNSLNGQPMSQASPLGVANKYLLQGSDASSVCLNCHQKSGDTGPTSYHISTPAAEMPVGTPPIQLSPAGDFGWLKKTYTWTPSSGAALQTSTGDSHGHNFAAADYGYATDTHRASAPGGSYPSSSMRCISCHDPHGRYRRSSTGSISAGGKPTKGSGSYAGSSSPDATSSVGVYRLLGGNGYYPKSVGSAYTFSNDPPVAVAPDVYNRSESATQTRVAYGSGVSDWCRNCHSNIHTDSNEPLKHPAGPGSGDLTGSDIYLYYDQYVKDGNLTGTVATAYQSLASFEVGTSNYTTLKAIVTGTPTKGPSLTDGTPNVMCLTCHRAHASGWDSALRFNKKATYIVYNGFYSQAGQTYQPYGQGRSEAEALRAYYDNPASKFATQQHPLCYKCHQTGTK